MKNDFANLAQLKAFKEHPVSNQIDNVFKTVIKQGEKMVKKHEEHDEIPSLPDNDFSLDSGLEIDLEEGSEGTPSLPENEFELSSEIDINMGEESSENSEDDGFGEISFSDESPSDDLNLDDDLSTQNDDSLDLSQEDSLSLSDEDSLSLSDEEDLNLSDDASLSLSDEDSLNLSDDVSLSLSDENDLNSSEEDDVSSFTLTELRDDIDSLSLSEDSSKGDFDLGEVSSMPDEDSLDLSDAETRIEENVDMSEDAREKLKEIDAILDYDASQVKLNSAKLLDDLKNLDEPLVSEDLNFENIKISEESESKKEKVKKKKKEQPTLFSSF